MRLSSLSGVLSGLGLNRSYSCCGNFCECIGAAALPVQRTWFSYTHQGSLTSFSSLFTTIPEPQEEGMQCSTRAEYSVVSILSELMGTKPGATGSVEALAAVTISTLVLELSPTDVRKSP